MTGTITSVDGKLVHGEVKTARSRRVIDVDPVTVATLRAWRRTHLEHRLLVGSAWVDTGLVFTVPTGEGCDPTSISQAFDRLVRATAANASETPIPRIRFHDLRHTRAPRTCSPPAST